MEPKASPHADTLLYPPPADPRTPAITPGLPRLPPLKALTSVRFFAALHVALYHFVRPFSLWGPFAATISVGYTGVSFFFFLSGFILTYAHADAYEAGRDNPNKFWVARFARIYPVYLFIMLLAALISGSQFRNPIHSVAYLADLLLLQAWSMRMVNFFHSGAWTLSVEAFFYLLFPFLLMRLRPKTRAAAVGFIALFYALAMFLPMLELKLYPAAAWVEPEKSVPGSLRVFTTTRLPLFALPEFLAGVSAGWLFLRFKPSEKSSAWMAVLGVILLASALFFADRLPYIALHNGLLIPIYALLLLGLSQRNWITSLLSGSFLVLLGEASYALYLLHALTLQVGHWMHWDQGTLFPLVNLALTIAASVLLHLYLERPARRAVLAWWARRHPTQLKIL